MKFKIGDKVKIVAWHGATSSEYENLVGKTSRIKSFYEGTSRGYNLEIFTPGAYWTDNELEPVKENRMSSKFYRVLRDTPLWGKDAIIECDDEDRYTGITDLWDVTESQVEYLSADIVEAKENAAFFERVYPIGELKKRMFGNKLQAQAAAKAMYKEGK